MEVVCANCPHHRASHNLIVKPTVRRPACRVLGCACRGWQPVVT